MLYLPELIPSVSSRSLQQSAEMLGVTVITDETDDAQSQLNMILDFGVTTLFSTPNKLLSFANFLEKEGLTVKDLPLMNLLCEIQYCSPVIRKKLEAIVHILKELDGNEGLIVASKVADRVGITRSVIVNALRKFESAGVIESKSLGMKGTFIKVLNDHLFVELTKLKK